METSALHHHSSHADTHVTVSTTDNHLDGPDVEQGASPDAIFADLEKEDDSAFRAVRAQQLSEELKKYTATRSMERQTVETLSSDDEVLRFTTENPRAVLHFFHPDFGRCGIMDKHLQKIAEIQRSFGGGDMEIMDWGRVDVKDAPFVVDKMGVRILPCVIGFRDGVVVGRVVGFEGLLWGEGAREDGDETTRALEGRLVEWKVLSKALVRAGLAREENESESDEADMRNARKGIRDRKTSDQDDDDHWD